MTKGKDGVQVEVRAGEPGDQVCSQHGDAGIRWTKEGRAVDRTGEKRAKVVLDKRRRRRVGDHRIFGEDEEVLEGERGVVG